MNTENYFLFDLPQQEVFSTYPRDDQFFPDVEMPVGKASFDISSLSNLAPDIPIPSNNYIPTYGSGYPAVMPEMYSNINANVQVKKEEFDPIPGYAPAPISQLTNESSELSQDSSGPLFSDSNSDTTPDLDHLPMQLIKMVDVNKLSEAQAAKKEKPRKQQPQVEDDDDDGNMDDLVLYKGRKITRKERLRQMRESQRKLRAKRAQQINEIKVENEQLKREVEMLKTDNNILTKVITSEVPNFTIGKVLTFVPHLPLSKSFVSYDRLTTAYPGRPIHRLFINREFFLQDITRTMLDCVEHKRELSIHNLTGPYCKAFAYLPVYGYSMFAKYIKEIELSVELQEVPIDWITNDDKLPANALSVNGIIDYLLSTANLEYLNFDVLKNRFLRDLFGTQAGPTIFKDDLIEGVNEATSRVYYPPATEV